MNWDIIYTRTWPILMYYSIILLQKLRRYKLQPLLFCHSRSADLHSNTVPPDYKSDMLTTIPWRSVLFFWNRTVSVSALTGDPIYKQAERDISHKEIAFPYAFYIAKDSTIVRHAIRTCKWVSVDPFSSEEGWIQLRKHAILSKHNSSGNCCRWHRVGRGDNSVQEECDPNTRKRS